ncbi:PEP-CTERM sorting domain-containing protein [Falsiroseomonas oryzae]|uniref:PEP-CTERM sorting domain-containing protein n=1 Tax=Falsiroseomonas oryzae TaxID=2766473 RepID=UPI0022EA4C32|nr:PEP-CTERM sorting domain-containing protein [Roseomonas sp. MO-31]
MTIIINGTPDADTFGSTSDEVERIFGLQGNDRMTGRGRNNTLLGGDGEDTLISEGDGFRNFFGGLGADVYVILPVTTPDFAETRINDFNRSQGDLIDVSAFVNLTFADIQQLTVFVPQVVVLADNNLLYTFPSLQASDFIFYQAPPPTGVPEPGTAALLGVAMLAGAVARLRRR